VQALWDYSVGDDSSYSVDAYLQYNSSVLLPINLNVSGSEDRVMRFGGLPSTYVYPTATATPATNVVETCTPNVAANNDWQTATPMLVARAHANAVLLPDDSILLTGGTVDQRNVDPNALINNAEFLLNGVWTPTPTFVKRGYHHAAVLLASGKVFVGGGEGRLKDYQIYYPPYLFKPNRPGISGIQQTTLNYGQEYWVGYSFEGASGAPYVQRVVLMRPGSVTHHSDFDQRSIMLKMVDTTQPGAVGFVAPPDAQIAPKGFYMLFLVSDTGVPSVATWVQVQ